MPFALTSMLMGLVALLTGARGDEAAPPARQDVVAIYQTNLPGRLRVFEASPDGRARIEDRAADSRAAADGYILVTADGRNLSVTRRRRLAPASESNEWVVVEANDLPRHPSPYARQRSTGEPPGTRSEPALAFEEAGEGRVGEWTGTRYVLPHAPGTNPGVSEAIILRRADLAPLGRAFRANSLYAWSAGGPMPRHMRQLAGLFAAGVPLRVAMTDGVSLTLIRLEFRPADPARFTPPSPLLSREALDRLLDSRRSR